MDTKELASHAGKTQALANMCVALVVAHPMPAEVQKIFEKLCKQTIEKSGHVPEREAYATGLASIANLLSEATGVAVAADLLSALPQQVGH